MNHKSIAFQSAILIVILGLIAFCIRSQIFSGRRQKLSEARFIPAEGLAENQTHGLVPGNPENGIQDLKEMYRDFQIFGSRHSEAYPLTVTELMLDMAKNRIYGFHGVKSVLAVFLNPDSQYSDDPWMRRNPDKAICYYFGKQHSASNDPSHSKEEAGDIIAYTDIYYHRNVKHFPGLHDTVNPVGFYLVLWGDGRIVQVPYDKVLYAAAGDGDFHVVFPGTVRTTLPSARIFISSESQASGRNRSKMPRKAARNRV